MTVPPDNPQTADFIGPSRPNLNRIAESVFHGFLKKKATLYFKRDLALQCFLRLTASAHRRDIGIVVRDGHSGQQRTFQLTSEIVMMILITAD